MVAGYAAKALVAGGVEPGGIAIISADSALPYERPPLSKGFLAGSESADEILINDDAFYNDHGIDVRLNMRVTAVDPSKHCILTEAGERIDYEKLLIATGAVARRLDVPGGDLDGVMYLRSMADSRAIRERAGQAKRAVTIGGGFI